jgi:glycerophosphoryl diester phosphodiesterase
MKIGHFLQVTAMDIADGIYARCRQPKPSCEKLSKSKIVAHRGAHGNGVLENTLAAFDLAADCGVWGLEMDLRWTADLHPVIHHDASLARIFDSDEYLNKLNLDELRARFPLIPTLAEVIARYGGRVHLMLEIKAERYPQPEKQSAILKAHLAGLRPVSDYHFLALDPALFSQAPFVAPKALLPVAETNLSAMSRIALESGFGGVLGHYVLLDQNCLYRHKDAGQSVGTAYVRSLNCLYRELNRGVTWIFSNHAAKLQAMLDASLAALPE